MLSPGDCGVKSAAMTAVVQFGQEARQCERKTVELKGTGKVGLGL